VESTDHGKRFIVKDKENERKLSSDFTEKRSKPPRAPLPRRKQLLHRPTTESASKLQTKQQATTF
jgi:hypothetical protein